MGPYAPSSYRTLDDYREALRGSIAQRHALRNIRNCGMDLVSRAAFFPAVVFAAVATPGDGMEDNLTLRCIVQGAARKFPTPRGANGGQTSTFRQRVWVKFARCLRASDAGVGLYGSTGAVRCMREPVHAEAPPRAVHLAGNSQVAPLRLLRKGALSGLGNAPSFRCSARKLPAVSGLHYYVSARIQSWHHLERDGATRR